MSNRLIHQALAMRIAKRYKRRGPNTFAKRGGALAGQYKVTGGHLATLKALSKRTKTWHERARRKRVRMIDQAKAVQTLATAERRKDAWLAELNKRQHRDKQGACVYDDCRSAHTTMPTLSAWPEAYDPWSINWAGFEKQWTYDRSMRLYVRQ